MMSEQTIREHNVWSSDNTMVVR